ncbi:MAG: IS21 family transposase [Gemmatimonadota bacterium]|nr:MAG: IS21 family transposase [Gemmatimonadota bacterium]
MIEQTRNEIVRRWHGGASKRTIARALRISRNSVQRVLAAYEADRSCGPHHPDLPKRRVRRPSKLDAYDATMQELLARYPDITATRMLEELRARGFVGGYTIVRQRVGELRPRPAREPVIRFETAPGAQAQMDYAVYDLDFSEEGRRRVNLFGYLLGYSRRQYLRFVASQDFETTVREHIRAFAHLGGVAATCVYDNMKVVVSRYEGDEPVYNPRFLAFATHYGFRPWVCRRRRPQTKGKIERPFLFVQTSLLNGRRFRSVAHLNEVTSSWLADVADVRVHRTTKRRPVDLHAEERPHLLPLPDKPYDVSQVVYRTVSLEGFVAYRQNLYSVPWQHVGRVLAVRITEDGVIIYGPQIEEIARHPLFPRTTTGQRSAQKAHRPDRAVHQRHAILKDRFVELGPSAVRFFEGLVQGQRCGKDQASKVLALLGTYRQEDLAAALERAVRFQAFSLRAVERILAAQARPKTPLESLADEHQLHLQPLPESEPVPPRGPDEYQRLLPWEPPEDGDPSEEGTNEQPDAS